MGFWFSSGSLKSKEKKENRDKEEHSYKRQTERIVEVSEAHMIMELNIARKKASVSNFLRWFTD